LHSNHGAATQPVSIATPQPTLPVTVVQMVENLPGHYLFQPSSLTITAGTVVVWIDNSDAPHTVTSDSGARAPSTHPGQDLRLQFNQAGPTTITATFIHHHEGHRRRDDVGVEARALLG